MAWTKSYKLDYLRLGTSNAVVAKFSHKLTDYAGRNKERSRNTIR